MQTIHGNTNIIQNILQMGISIGSGTLKLLFPPRCSGCDRIDIEGFCGNCREEFEWIDVTTCCWKCGAPSIAESPGIRVKCPDCRELAQEFDEARAVFRYSGPIARAIVLWKYEGHREFSEYFSTLVVEWLGSVEIKWLKKIDFVIPSPLHEKTVKMRGFSPPEDLSKVVASELDAPWLPRILFKPRYTRPQAELERDQRKRNLLGSMKVYDPDLIKGKNILVVDDVMTTGATMDECARALKKAGVGRVYCLVVARQADAVTK